MLDPVRVVDSEQEIQDVAAAITVTAQISQNRSIVIQTYLPRDAAIGDYHDLLDKAQASIDRQEARDSLEREKTSLAADQAQLKNLENDYVVMPQRAEQAWIASGKKGPYKPNAHEIAQKGVTETNIRGYRDRLKIREAEIARLEAVIAKRD